MTRRAGRWFGDVAACASLALGYAVLWLVVWVAVPSLLFGWTPRAIVSGSMEPGLSRGDVVLTSGDDLDDLGPGTVISYDDPARDGEITTHRIVGVDDDGAYRTRGDGNRQPDSTPLDPERVQGVGRLVVPLVGAPVVWLRDGEVGRVLLMVVGGALLVSSARHRLRGERVEQAPVADPSSGPVLAEPRVLTVATLAVMLVLTGGPGVVERTALSGSTFSGVASSVGQSVTAGTWGPLVTGALVHSCGVRGDGSVWCWGRNDKGQLGDGSTVPSDVARAVRGVGGSGALGPVSVLEAGSQSSHTCAVLADSTAACWGLGDQGQLGSGVAASSSVPVRIVVSGGGSMTGVTGVAPGLDHTCVVRSDSSVWCVGRNDKGQLGDGTTTNRLVAVRVLGVGGVGFLSGAVAVTSGEKHSCALLSDTTVVCWGDNGQGQLGDATVVDSASPRQVLNADLTGLAFVDGITAGHSHTCAVTASSSWCWGNNSDGQLGDGTTADASTTRLVRNADTSTFTGAVQLDAGALHTCARTDAGAVWCWGRNDKGQLGNGTTTSSLAPVQVSGFPTVADIGIGGTHGCSVHQSGAGVCWGLNSDGQLGDGTTTDRLVPVSVQGPW